MLDSSGDLAIAELVFWSPATILAGVVCFRHGFKRQVGWIFIVLLGLARLIGAACTVAAEQQTTPDPGLVAAAAITNSIGTSFLISVLIGLLSRVAEGTKIPLLPARALRILQLGLLVAIILGIVGGTKLNDKSDRSEGLTLLKVSVVLFAIAFIAVIVGLSMTTINLRHVPSGERRLVVACWLSSPFILVRIVYSLADVFAQTAIFNYYNPNIWVRAFMAVLEEFVVAIIVITVGFLTQAIVQGQVHDNTYTASNHQAPLDSRQPNYRPQEYGQA